VKDQAKSLLMSLAKEKDAHNETERNEAGSDMDISQVDDKSTLDASDSVQS